MDGRLFVGSSAIHGGKRNRTEIQLVKFCMANRMRRRGNEMQNVEQRCDKVKRESGVKSEKDTQLHKSTCSNSASSGDSSIHFF
jgi:hypothetical protein